MVIFLEVICIFLSAGIIACVSLQQTKSEGLSGLGGLASGSTYRGSRRDEMLARLTRGVGIAWALTHLFLAAYVASRAA